MKNLLHLTFLALILVLTTACPSDDDSGPILSAEEALVGTWEVVEYDAEYSASGFFNMSTTIEGRDFEGEVTFSDNPKEWESAAGATFDITEVFSVGGGSETETFSVEVEKEMRSGTWEINEDGRLEGFQMVDPDYDETPPEEIFFEVEVVNNNRIILTTNIEETFIDDGVPVDFTGTTRSVLVRK